MAKTSQILFHSPTKLKQAAIKRAEKFDLSLTEVLNEALESFVAGGVDPEPLSKAELASIKKSQKQAKNGENIPLSKILKKYAVA